MKNKEDMAKWLTEQINKDLQATREHRKVKRKMPPEELQLYMRERSRGNGIHGARQKPREKSPRNWGD
jgi:hypothetical protein